MVKKEYDGGGRGGKPKIRFLLHYIFKIFHVLINQKPDTKHIFYEPESLNSRLVPHPYQVQLDLKNYV